MGAVMPHQSLPAWDGNLPRVTGRPGAGMPVPSHADPAIVADPKRRAQMERGLAEEAPADTSWIEFETQDWRGRRLRPFSRDTVAPATAIPQGPQPTNPTPVVVAHSTDWDPDVVFGYAVLDRTPTLWSWTCDCGRSHTGGGYLTDEAARGGFVAHKYGIDPLSPASVRKRTASSVRSRARAIAASKNMSLPPLGASVVLLFLGAGGVMAGPLAVLLIVACLVFAVVVMVKRA